MFISTIKKFAIPGIIGGAVLGLALTLGGNITSQSVEIWRKDASNVVRLFPTTLTVNIGTSAFSSGTFTQGGGIRATSTDDTTATLLASDFDVENIIDFTPNVPAITLSLPASSTLSSFAPTAGNVRTVYIRNSTTTATTLGDVIIAGGTGTLLKIASSSPSAAVLLGDTDAGNYAKLDFVRKSNTDFEVLITSFKD